MSAESGLARLAESTGEPFKHLFAARDRTAEGLAAQREKLSDFACERSFVALTGSWGRAEITSESDDDWLLVYEDDSPPEAEPTVEQLEQLLGVGDKRPGIDKLFPGPTSVDQLKTIGRDDDTNQNLTRRMLLLLEGVALAGSDCFETTRRSLIDSYLNANVKDYRPPRFLLNDVVRYWRTIAVDFESKHRDREGEGWGLRNAKLRLSRKMLFAGGLIPVLRCVTLPNEEMPALLEREFRRLPSDRIADAFLENEMPDAGARVFSAYDEFIAILNDPDKRTELKTLPIGGDSDLFQRVKALGEELEGGLLTLLFDDPSLNELVREYLIF